MFISNITLEDFKIYYGHQKVVFPRDPKKNVFIISGNNGFGKTTLLNSLVWCLYGKLMIDVDDKYRSEIYDAGGYKKFAAGNLNKYAQAKGHSSYSVSLAITDISIPSLSCDELIIKRTFDLRRQEDKIEILLDGKENELTREVGPDIFINDFILPKEIAKFFFFDAEKIVSLAEMKSIDDKRKLSLAYSEVLGIKKYEDLKINLEDIRIRLRKDTVSGAEGKKYAQLQKELLQCLTLIQEYEDQITALKDEKITLKSSSEQYQIKLIREGNSLTIDELKLLREKKDKLAKEAEKLREQLKEMMELAPFAISGKLLERTYQQVASEYLQAKQSVDPTVLKAKLQKVKKDLAKEFQHLRLSNTALKQLSQSFSDSIERHFAIAHQADLANTVLVNFTDSEKHEFDAIYNNLKYSFSRAFKDLTSTYKNNRVAFNKVIRQLSDAEAKEDDILIREIRQQKTELDDRIDQIDERINYLNFEICSLQKENANKSKLVSELEKKIALLDMDKEKDEVAARLISELNAFLVSLKLEKKISLESRIRKELNVLMHKRGFINKVSVEISNELIDIHLLDRKGNVIAKEALSKGEQQLYATALLKSLVDESNIQFPVFIDSPLQKFDKTHSHNIIKDFYPGISDQVVLFPLIEKEMTYEEFEMLVPKINKAYLIKQEEEYHSELIEVPPTQLFKQAKEIYEYVR